MKRQLTLAIALIIIAIVSIQLLQEKKPVQTQDISLSDTKETTRVETQIEKTVESPAVVTSSPESKREELPVVPAEEQKPALTVAVEPETSESAPEENIPEETDIATTEEETLSIVMISVCESEEETTLSSENAAGIKGFRIQGNPDNLPLNLIVKSHTAEGCDQIHFLDWNGQHPNEFALHDALRGDTSVSVFADEIKVAQFSVPTETQDEYFALNLKNNDLTLAYAE